MEKTSHIAYSFVLIIMHCTNQNCFDDTCQGECQKQNEKLDDCRKSSCGCHEEIEENVAYCEDS